MDNEIKPEYLFQIVGELTIENRMLKKEILRLQKEFAEKIKEKTND